MRNSRRFLPPPVDPENEPRYLTAVEVAERYGRPLGWVYTCKKLPRRKVGKYLTYLESDLLKFEDYRNSINRGFFMRPDPQAAKRQKARKRLKFDAL